MKRLFKCLGLFVGWLQGGLYDFSSLPISVFKHLIPEDLDTIMKTHLRYSCKLLHIQVVATLQHVCVQLS